MKDASSHSKESKTEIMQPAIIKSSNNSKKQGSDTAMVDETSKEIGVRPFSINPNINETVTEQIQNEMENRKKNWMKNYKTKLDLNDVLEIRNPQSVVEFIPEIISNMKEEEKSHMYDANFLDKEFQTQISEKYRQYLVDWLAELHYKFKMWPETLYVTVGIIDKTLMLWKDF